MFLLKWTNKYSKETGYVANISKTNKHFINTFNKSDAKLYKTMTAAKRMLTSLKTYGETENNDFEIVES